MEGEIKKNLCGHKLEHVVVSCDKFLDFYNEIQNLGMDLWHLICRDRKFTDH